jgi:hypothetical protein
LVDHRATRCSSNPRARRTIKELLGARLLPPLSAARLTARLDRALLYYADLRPHQGLNGSTPNEVLNNAEPKAATAIPPPRIGQRQPPGDHPLPLEVVYLDPERRLPILVPTDKAA